MSEAEDLDLILAFGLNVEPNIPLDMLGPGAAALFVQAEARKRSVTD